jgi:type II secretory pathway pseudopilin PulG
LKKDGFTLIELVIFIVVAGIFVPLAFIAFSGAIKSGTTPEFIVKARFIAEQKMEDITRFPFNSLPAAQTAYIAVPGNAGYEWKWAIDQLSPADISTVTPPVTDYTKYKKIVVYVREPNNYEYKVFTIVTQRP